MSITDTAELSARLRNDADVLLAPATLDCPAPHLSTRLLKAADALDRLQAELADTRNQRDYYQGRDIAALEIEEELIVRAERAEAELAEARTNYQLAHERAAENLRLVGVIEAKSSERVEAINALLDCIAVDDTEATRAAIARARKASEPT